MKKQINPSIKAYLIRGIFYLVLLMAICAIPLVLAQPGSRIITKQSVARSAPTTPLGLSTAKMANALLRHTGLEKKASVKGNDPLLTYMIDDGTAENSIGLTNGGSFVACNEFAVEGGNNIITSISIAWGTPLFPEPSLDGLAYTAVLWSDPNGDGSPTDAVVLAQAPGVISQQGTNTFITSTIPPTMVTTPNFFVGFIITHTAGQHPAAFDQDAPTLSNRSWVAQTNSINDLSGAITIESAGLIGNWLIRAEGEGGGTPSPTPTATCAQSYTTTTSSGTITPGGTDIGNHCDDCTTDIVLPFSVSVYGNPPVTSVAVGSDGDIHFPGPYNKLFWWMGCIPIDPGTGQDPFLNTFFPYYADLVTDTSVGPCPDCGIFTQTVGTAPNRQFIIRWKANYFNSPPGPAQAEFEVLLTEGSDTLSVIYGVTGDNGLTAVSGIQKDLNVFTSFSCDEATLIPGLRVDYIPTGCGSPSPTPSVSPTTTGTPTATATATATASGSASPTTTPSSTASPTPSASATPSATATATASPSATGTPSATATVTPSGTPSATPTPSGTPFACVRGQGYWKNHPEAWPVTELQLGNVTYTQDQLLAILHEPPRGNGLLILAHQLIAAKLNIAAGADPSCIQDAIAQADALIGDLVIPPVGNGYLPPSEVGGLAGILGQFNEGNMCAPACEGSPRPTATPTPRGRPQVVPRPR